ncbi:STAT2 protein, partial [Herpetotheres cachinnans]|nr:STAT2 protein [Herpetotheres cachinnans]
LEDMQDAFDFCFKVYYLPGENRTDDPQYAQQIQALQAKLQILDRQRRVRQARGWAGGAMATPLLPTQAGVSPQEVLAQMQQLLGRSETLRDFLQQELEAWQERQQRACLGAPVDTRLQLLETWFTELGQGLFQLLQLLRALGDLRQKVSYERDPLKAETPLLERRLLELLTYLLRRWVQRRGVWGGWGWGSPDPPGAPRAFVVEQQPSTPNACKRPLVLRTASKFSARARLLVRLHDRNHRMEAKIHIDRSGPPGLSLPHRFRKFNILTSSSKTLLAGDSPQDGLVCDFQYLTLKEQKDSRSGKGSKGIGEVGAGLGAVGVWGRPLPRGAHSATSAQGPLVVTEELHLITFTLAYAYCGLELELEVT